MSSLGFKPKQVVKRLLAVLPTRARDVVTSRYGLGTETRRQTLESIGKRYGITRERVRQIENYGIASIRKSSTYQKEKASFAELETFLDELGGIVAEEELLTHSAKDKQTQNCIHFLLVVGEAFKKEREDDYFKHRWYVDGVHAKRVHEALRKLAKGIGDSDLLSELDVIYPREGSPRLRISGASQARFSHSLPRGSEVN
ncbi:MAG: Uncharacterized protein G01um101472_277 [Parcubacteria group bacterium Gr01-1014_72]|nr:MAG: Uncharacterized protein G01um101472_277 [Parcubacteria group bacterium Gr01-1014_72]